MKKRPNKKKEIIKKYDLTSHFYDDRYINIQNEKYEYIVKGFSFSNKILLDAGCGTGLFYYYVLEHLKDDSDMRCNILGVDISWNMLKEFSLKLKKKEKLTKHQICLVLSDLENLPFREDAFHAIFSLTSLQNLPNIINGVKESFRVTKNNGDVKLSILKKKLDLDELLSYIKPEVSNLEITEKDDLEDVILSFTLRKKRQ